MSNSIQKILKYGIFLLSSFLAINCVGISQYVYQSTIPFSSTPITAHPIINIPTINTTFTPTIAIMPTFSSSLTFTPTTTSEFNHQGTYYFNKCVSYAPRMAPEFVPYETLCINAVKVNEDLSLQFIMNWISDIRGTQCYDHEPDINTHNILIKDDLNNSYSYIDAGGCAAVKRNLCGVLSDRDNFADCTGWLLFPPPIPEAKIFKLIDNNNGVMIEDIVLL